MFGSRGEIYFGGQAGREISPQSAHYVVCIPNMV